LEQGEMPEGQRGLLPLLQAESKRLKAESNRIGYCRIFFERPLLRPKAIPFFYCPSRVFLKEDPA